MNENGYNGWSNWETWNVDLWVDNMHDLYTKKWRTLRCYQGNESLTGEIVKAFVDLWMAGTTPDFEGDDISRVNWQEIAESWRKDWQEEEEYRTNKS